MALVEVRQVSKQFQQGETVIPVLRDLSFGVEAGDTVAIVGQSGCGKSTSGNLDTATGGKVMNLLFDAVTQRGMSLILVTHDMQLASRCKKRQPLVQGQLQTLRSKLLRLCRMRVSKCYQR
ncbi:MAG TPA: ATP-binding cassette domain-containing protein [Oligoflexus sp.]|uniref:ATP-binding cassette domain-containing protein n=1 Tax=Oligoflexus sp. TaxID=1971216 RepID=UPI002D80768B|nr:ATP-binding cassette domain-containing protein [Oligoflexus sp.]HET9240294.1 ATP-binding cassette domain-containing protein [Oligoflexus sp.]